jgi:hypothetical protein
LIYFGIKFLAPFIRKKRKEKKFLRKMKLKEDNEMRKRGWSSEIHYLYNDYHKNILIFLLCLKTYERKFFFKVPKYLKFSIIKDFVDNWEGNNIEILESYISGKKKNDRNVLTDSNNQLLLDY